MKLKNLSIITIILCVISVFIFINENKRGADLILGSDYIKGFDVEKINKIIINSKDSKEIILSRDGNKFYVSSQKAYPAASEKVNDFIYKIASIQVEEKVASDANNADLKKYELGDQLRHHQIEFYGKDGKRAVSFQVGKIHKGKGNYLLKNGEKEVYLSMNILSLNYSYKDFVNTTLLDIEKDNINEVHLKSDKEIELTKESRDFALVTPKAKKFKEEKIEEYYKSFNNIRFSDYFKPSDSEVKNLNFNKYVKIKLKNKLVYNISLAKNKDQYFVKLNILLDEMPKEIIIKRDDGKEKLQKIEDMLKARGDAEKMNLEKANWVYQIDKFIYEKMLKKEKFFL